MISYKFAAVKLKVENNNKTFYKGKPHDVLIMTFSDADGNEVIIPGNNITDKRFLLNQTIAVGISDAIEAGRVILVSGFKIETVYNSDGGGLPILAEQLADQKFADTIYKWIEPQR